jgi:GTP pyrophosphokinase
MNKENRKTFNGRLRKFSKNEQKNIEWAYDLAKESHRTQVRQNGERYFEHARGVALIILDEFKIKDSDMVIAALLHDVGEDTPTLGPILYSKWKQTATYRLTRNFNNDVAKMIIALTKARIDGKEIKNKKQMYKMYYSGLHKANTKTKLVKLADRLYNLRTMSDLPKEKIEKNIKETNEIYLPIFKNIKGIYKTQANYGISEIEKQLKKLNKELKSRKK